MNVKVEGFTINCTKLPLGIGLGEIYERIEALSSLSEPKEIRTAVTPYNVTLPTGEERMFWLGIMLKVRDANRFTKMTQKDGRNVICSEQMSGSDKLAETSFFVADPISGGGLYASHRNSPGMISQFSQLMTKNFHDLRDAKRSVIDKSDSLSQKAKVTMRKNLSGFVQLIKIVKMEDFELLVSKMKKVKRAKVLVGSYVTFNNMFFGSKIKPKAEYIEYVFEESESPLALSRALSDALKTGEVKSANVEGTDENNQKTKYYNETNVDVLAVFDYDELMGEFEINLDDCTKSLEECSVIQKLLTLIVNKNIWKLVGEFNGARG